MYEPLVFVHILSAMIWVGGGLVLITVEIHAVRVGGSHARPDNDRERMARRLDLHSGAALGDRHRYHHGDHERRLGLLPALGLPGYGFDRYEFVMGTREIKRMKRARERGVDTPEFGLALKAYRRMAPVASGMLAVIVFLIVFKPGA